MARRSGRASFTISWPFIIAMIVGYNVFFGEDDPSDKTVVEETVQVESGNEQLKENRNKIDETINKIKNEIETSVVIQEVKQEVKKLADEVKTEFNSGKTKDDPPPDEKPKETPPPVIQEEEKSEPELEPLDDNQPEDTMKSL